MAIKLLEKKYLSGFVENLMKGRNVIGVTKKGNRFAFAGLKSPADLCLDYDVTLLSPKKFTSRAYFMASV